jgi:general secretion pathway protein D
MASDSDSKLIQNPQIRALDGQKASLKIGQRIPIATGSYQSGIAGGVNTQFQYVDVGVNIDITPRIHANNDVTLKTTLEISSVDSFQTVDGVSEPVIGQRRIDHEIRLREGEANVVGGMLTDTDTKSSSGYPWVSSVPFLKYFFSATNAEKAQTELVFVLIPRIVRGTDLNPLNMKPLDIGTANSIELRRLTTAPVKPTPTPASMQTTPVPGGQPPAQTPPPTGPPQAPPPSAQAPSGPNQSVVLGFNPAQLTATVGQTFTTDLVVSGAQNLFSVPVQLQYDPSKLELVNVSSGSFLAQGDQAVALVHRDDPATGVMRVTASRPPNSGGASGQGPVFTLTFVAKAPGQTTIAITRAGLKDSNNQSVPANGTQQTVEIRPKPQ